MNQLVFLPGHLCDERAWRPVAELLHARGHAVAHARLDDDDDVNAMARRALDTCEGPLVAIGFSMGAIVALAMHRAAPERIEALCLANINAGPDLPERTAARLNQQQAVRSGQLRAVVREQLIPHYFAAASPRRDQFEALCIDMAEAVGSAAFIRQSEALRVRPDARPGLAKIACPALVIAAEEDRLCPPEWHRATAAAIPGASLRMIGGASHMALLEQSAEMAGMIGDWLETVSGDNHDV